MRKSSSFNPSSVKLNAKPTIHILLDRSAAPMQSQFTVWTQI
jgi:hypothetical protein